MKISRFFVVLLTVFMLFILKTFAQNSNGLIVQLNEKIKQGDTVLINIKSDKNLVNPSFMYDKGKKIKIFKTSTGSYKGFLGIEGLEKTGYHSLILKDDTGILNIEKKINVLSANMPSQYITLSGKKGSLTATPDEIKKINMAKSTVTNSAYFDVPPFKIPTKGCISSVYGLKRFYNGELGGYHKGLDIKANQGDSIYAFTNGKVLIAQQFRLNGGTIAVDHGYGIVSFYLHMSKINVKAGQVVIKGQKIGEVGSTGISTGPHLHFGVYINGTPVNPLSYWGENVVKCK